MQARDLLGQLLGSSFASVIVDSHIAALGRKLLHYQRSKTSSLGTSIPGSLPNFENFYGKHEVPPGAPCHKNISSLESVRHIQLCWLNDFSDEVFSGQFFSCDGQKVYATVEHYPLPKDHVNRPAYGAVDSPAVDVECPSCPSANSRSFDRKLYNSNLKLLYTILFHSGRFNKAHHSQNGKEARDHKPFS